MSLGLDLGDDVRRRGAARSAEHPFHVRGDRQTPHTRREIANLQPRNLDRIVQRHELRQLERNVVRGVLEEAVAVAVANHVRRAILADWQRGRSPQLAGVEILDVEHFAGTIADAIVGPLRNLMLLAVDCPRVSSALDRDLESERRICDHVDPRRRRPLALAENRQVLTAVRGKSAEPVEKFDLAPRHQDLRPPYRREFAAAAALPPARTSPSRLTCSDSVPRRLSSTARATVCSTLRSSAETRSARSTKIFPQALCPSGADRAGTSSEPGPRARLAVPDGTTAAAR